MQTVSRGRKRARTEPKDVGKWQIADEIKEERSERMVARKPSEQRSGVLNEDKEHTMRTSEHTMGF